MMKALIDYTIDYTTCRHEGGKMCQPCKDKSAKVVIWGSTIIGGIVIGGSTCIISGIHSCFTGIFDYEICLMTAGIGALAGWMIGITVALESGMIQINKEALKSAVEQSNRERAGLNMEARSRYNSQMSDYYSGRRSDFPYLSRY